MSVLYPISHSETNTSADESSEHSEGHDASEGLVMLLGVLLLIGCFVKTLVKRFPRVPLPFTVLLLFIGVLIGAIANIQSNNQSSEESGHQINAFHSAIGSFTDISPHLALYIFLPVLIFDSGFNVHYHLFIQSLGASLMLAVPGAMLALISVAILSKFGFDYQWDWSQSLMLGAILSTTDPIAVVSLLRELGASQQLAMLIESESLMNDGAAFVVYLVTQSALLGGDSSAGAVVKRLFQYSIGGPAFGFAVAVITVIVMGFIYSDAEVEIVITIAVTYVCFWIADKPLGLSGVLAIAMLGVYMSKHRYVVSPSVQPSLQAVWQLLIFCVNILVFVLSGLIIADKLIGTRKNIRGVDVVWLICLYVLLHVVRYASLLLFWPVFRRMGITLSWKDIVMIGWSGMRGAISLLLALITYLEPSYDQVFRDRLMFQVSGIVLLTLIVNGITSRYLMNYLGLNKGTPESRMVLNSALSHMRQQTASAIRQMKLDPKFKAVDWPQLRPYLPQQLILEMQQEQGLSDILSPSSSDSDDRNDRSNNQSNNQWDEGAFHASLPADHPMRRMFSMQSMGDLTLACQPTFVPTKQSNDQSNKPVADERSVLTSVPTRGGHLDIPNRPMKINEETPIDQPNNQSSNQSNIELQPVVSTMTLEPSGLQIRLSPANHPQPVNSALDENQPINQSIDQSVDSPVDQRRAAAPFMSMFEAPSEQEINELANKMDPPYHPPAPSFPPLGPQSFERSNAKLDDPRNNRSINQSIKQADKRPVNRRMHRRAQTEFMSSSNLNDPSVAQHKVNLHRELTNRFITAMAADYHKQFASGLISTDTLRILVAAAGAATDEASLAKQWSFIKGRLRPPTWLWALFVSPLNSDTVPFYLKPVRTVIRRWMFDHLKVSVELATAYLSAKQRLEYVLSAFPEFDEIDDEVVNEVRKQAGFYQRRALDAWMDVCEGYFEAHAAVVTRHAAILLLHYQQAEIASLQSTGMLEPNEYDHIASLISKRLIRLERRRLELPLTPSIDLLFQLPAFANITSGMQRRLKQIISDRSLRRWYRGHEQIWKRNEPPIGLMIIVRGTARSMFEYGECMTAHPSTTPLVNPAESSQHTKKSKTPRNIHSHPRSSMISAQSQQSKDRYFDTKGSGNFLGTYEALTDENSLASVSSVTMVEAYVLDHECVELLMQEDEFASTLIRSAAAALLKTYWFDWKINELIDQSNNQSNNQLHQYQLSMLVDRAVVHRVDRHETEVEVRADDRVLLLKGRARGRSIKRRIAANQAMNPVSYRLSSPANKRQSNEQNNEGNNRQRAQSKDDHHIPTPRRGQSAEPSRTRDDSDVGLQFDQPINPSNKPLSPSMLKPLIIPDSDVPIITGPSSKPTPRVQSEPGVDQRDQSHHCPIYPSPCFLSQRRGFITFEAGSIFLLWNRRDDQIASLHPPPPRAHLQEYAQQLGLTMQLAFSQSNNESNEPVNRATNRPNPLHINLNQTSNNQSSSTQLNQPNNRPRRPYVASATLQSMDARVGSYLGLPSTFAQPDWDPALTVGANHTKSVDPPINRLPVRRGSLDVPPTPAARRNQMSNQPIVQPLVQPIEQWIEVDEDEYESDQDDHITMDMNQFDNQTISDADFAQMMERAQNEVLNARTI